MDDWGCGVRLEPLANASPGRVLGVTLAALGLAFVLVGAVFVAYGQNPLEVYRIMLTGTLLDAKGWQEILRRSIPLLLIGVGLTLAFRAQFYNIGAEGQLLLGAVLAAGVALFVPLPAPLSLPAMALAGALGGALWCGLAAWLRLRFSVNEILSTLMLNYVAQSLVIFLINGPWRGKDVRGYIYSDRFAEYQQIPVWAGSSVHWPTLLLGVLLALVLQFVLFRTTLGFRMRIVGENPGAARYLGIAQGRVLLLLALITGGMAGLAGVGEIAGIHHRLIEPSQLSSGYGFTAIIVAWLARGHPALVLLTAPLMGLVLAGGDLLKVSLNMPFRIVDIFSGVILFCLIGSELFLRYRVRWGR